MDKKRKAVYNEAAKRATMKYLATLKCVSFRVKKEEYARYEDAAKKGGFPSMRQFILSALDEKCSKICSKIEN